MRQGCRDITGYHGNKVPRTDGGMLCAKQEEGSLVLKSDSDVIWTGHRMTLPVRRLSRKTRVHHYLLPLIPLSESSEDKRQAHERYLYVSGVI